MRAILIDGSNKMAISLVEVDDRVAQTRRGVMFVAERALNIAGEDPANPTRQVVNIEINFDVLSGMGPYKPQLVAAVISPNEFMPQIWEAYHTGLPSRPAASLRRAVELALLTTD